MSATRTITIVGGGLAGLALGIGLRRRDIPVTLWEAGGYPRHRVCGEFISGNGQEVLRRLDLLPLLERAGAIRVKSAEFISGANRSPVRVLPAPALGISRFVLDSTLAREYQRLGGDLRINTRRHDSDFSEGIVHATGRRAHPTENGWRWFGLKVHATNVNLDADLEMYVSENNYVGVNRINGGEVNVCGLFRGRAGETRETGFNLLRGESDSPLHERLASARFDENSFCSVAGLSLKPHRAVGNTECSVGDAITMIPPVTGNGMSMAFESAELAIEPLERYSHGEMPWAEAREAIARACDAAFADRLSWAHRLQWLMFSPVLRTFLGKIPLRSDILWSFLFARTR